RLNQALLLLSKIENRQFPDQTLIRPATLIRSILENFNEWMDEKHLRLETELEADVSLSMNPVLADVLLSNLIGNAIRHSKEHGTIRIRLTRRELQLENTGGPPVADGEKLFDRFHKADPSSRSLGLGLSIVRKICDVQGYTIRYEGRMPDVHRFVLGF
ncbi:MAG: sensor histidine kinase, partial [Flavobacteriales bacterium]|nr:sensor histidine kinase [Flavobacteriales bacterium]